LSRKHIINGVYETTCLHNEGSFSSYRDVFAKVIIRFRKIVIRLIKEERSVGNHKGDQESAVNVGNINPPKNIVVEV
jgi:hypothetical protein